jgi:alpha-beta hydrolase superfamily lysophospholipase
MRRRAVTLGLMTTLAACAVAPERHESVAKPPPTEEDGTFVMADGARLPYRRWLPADGAPPQAVILALHGFNDSRDAWEIPAPLFAAAGIALYAPDQRGFGAAPGRGLWPGGTALARDAATMARLLRARYPDRRLYLMGESMGGAVLLSLAASAEAPPVDGYVLVAPAVWGWSEMNVFLRAALWLSASVAPDWRLSGAAAHITASDNRAALIRLSTDPLTIHETRISTVRGLVDLMDVAQKASRHVAAPTLVLYGGRDELVPKPATAAAWRKLMAAAPADLRLAYYPGGYHLLLRDHAHAIVVGDILHWLTAPAAPLPSGADRAAQAWLDGK